MPISDDDIQWLFDLAEREDLAEIEVADSEGEVVVRRLEAPGPLLAAGAHPAAPAALPLAPVAPELPENVLALASPMSGVFYRAASPEIPPYVEVGQTVEPADIVGLIEAMKLFNDVPAGVAGVIHQVFVQNGQHVEAGQTLMLIET